MLYKSLYVLSSSRFSLLATIREATTSPVVLHMVCVIPRRGGGGSEVFAISAVYKNGEFLDYRVSHTMGNGLMEFEAEKLTEELANVGIPNPDARRVFDEFLPLTEFFDGNVHEFVHAEQHTVPAEQKGNYFTKVVSQTDFFPVEAM